MASVKILQNRINKKFNQLKEDKIIYPHLEIATDGLGANPPELKLISDYQLITLSIDNNEEVQVITRMRRGAGSEKEFTRKVEALFVLRKYVKRKYKDPNYVVKESLDNIKVSDDSFIYILTVGKSGEVEVKTRARKSKGNTIKDTKSTESTEPVKKSATKDTEPVKKSVAKDIKLTKDPIKEPVKKEEKELKSAPEKVEVKVAPPKVKKYSKVEEDSMVVNRYNKKSYKVIRDDGNVIEVFDPDFGYLTMARSDLLL